MGNLLIERVKELEREIAEIAAANHAYFFVADPIWEKSCCMKDGLSVCKRSSKSLLICDDPLREMRAFRTPSLVSSAS